MAPSSAYSALANWDGSLSTPSSRHPSRSPPMSAPSELVPPPVFAANIHIGSLSPQREQSTSSMIMPAEASSAPSGANDEPLASNDNGSAGMKGEKRAVESQRDDSNDTNYTVRGVNAPFAFINFSLVCICFRQTPTGMTSIEQTITVRKRVAADVQ
ncbi:uncharacterized protein LAESUDRAFT_764202 [Laetiporus sulphureus 93-53]|uniref:Uncharacterized protein n=1 Tax=Laetiporus sulphureus 93-53 TaxID=1314785 RepID=A0A165BEI6_9APHY|nr:uncharacterized protein LAESUDRAFT_764202 [Laetiporus sulphureus 93-53]KZT00883.1 hypothetical protein LAESUDRAFT_764202 [Laetiporus sulphureus 93-53]